MTTLILDTEVYCDYFLASVLNADTGEVRHYEHHADCAFDIKTVRRLLAHNRIVTFNGTGFDLPIISAALRGDSTGELKAIANKIIDNNLRHWQLDIDVMEVDHVDVIEVAPGTASLKVYGGRLHSTKLQSLPIDPQASIPPEQRATLRAYCENDLRTTLELYRTLLPQIELREKMSSEYGIDLRSKSDAQIAEAVIRHEVEARMGRKLKKEAYDRFAGRRFAYKPPAFLRFKTPVVRAAVDTVCSAEFIIAGNGTVQMPKAIAELQVAIGESTYRLGMGGLHSSEQSIAHCSDDEHVLIDRDVTSYYPNIILRCGLQPVHMGEHFTEVYRTIVERRLAAKRSGDQVAADALKITINGSFGKFGSPYSVLYSPTLLIQTTVTGQLALLMLIEDLESEGIPVVSANTDGIVMRCSRGKVPLMELVVLEWETRTGFEIEATEYRALYSRDVNNYIALKPDGGVKLKGAYAPAGLSKNPANEICSRAVLRFLRDGVPVETTIRECRDITRFVTVRTVKGGAIDQQGLPMGKAVRWYYATGVSGPLRYAVNGYIVPRSEGARALMDLPGSMPEDVNYDWYIAEAYSILRDIGCPQGVLA
jgi:hypothetical protein